MDEYYLNRGLGEQVRTFCASMGQPEAREYRPSKESLESEPEM